MRDASLRRGQEELRQGKIKVPRPAALLSLLPPRPLPLRPRGRSEKAAIIADQLKKLLRLERTGWEPAGGGNTVKVGALMPEILRNKI